MRKSTALLTSLGLLSLALAAAEAIDDRPSADGQEHAAASKKARPAARAAARPDAPTDDGVYRTDEVMISLRAGASLDDIAAEHDLVVRDAEPGSQVALLEVPEGMSRAALLAELAQDPRVRAAAPNAVMQGAARGPARKSGSTSNYSREAGGGGSATGTSYVDYQWHLADIDVPETARDLSGVTVAVLDSGVAYTATTIDGVSYVVPPSLQSTTFVSPKDCIDDDQLPLDEHQHGTHITSLIASDGDVKGVAPGVQIMPVRVLDANNSGTEYDLIEGLRWAQTRGADVINMSLAFPPGYVPSDALQDALQSAADAGIVLVGAAGNNARTDVPSWPAASPVVIGVGAYIAPDGGSDEAASYSNLGTSLDIMAPGGDLSGDYNKDGLADGMIGETIGLNDPSTAGPWMFAGTSQAAAVVSGAAAWLVSHGAQGEEVRAAMLNMSNFWGSSSFAQGLGAGGLNIDLAIDAVGTRGIANPDRYGAALLAWPAPVTNASGVQTGVQAKALVTIVDENGAAPGKALDIFGTMWGPTGATPWSCKLSATVNECALTGDALDIDAKTGDAPGAWAFSVDAVVEPSLEIPHRPVPVLYASDALELVLAARADDPSVAEMPLAVYWDAGSDAELGDVAGGYTVVNTGTGLATSPFGLVFTPSAMTLSTTDVDLDIDGTGLATSPIGLFRMRAITIDGTGLATSPIGFSHMRLLSFSGTGLATSPIGFTAHDLFTPSGTAPSWGMGMNGGVMFLDDAALVGTTGAGAATDDMLASGGFRTTDGYEVASVLVGSGAASVGLDANGSTVAMGESGMQLP